MEDVDMKVLEPSDEAYESSENQHVFKTPMIMDRCKLQVFSTEERSDCASPDLSSSPDFSSRDGSLSCSTELTHGHHNEMHDLIARDYQFSCSPGSSSLRVNMLRSLDMSPDSGVDCASFCSSVKDSVVTDSDEDQLRDPSPAIYLPVAQGVLSSTQAEVTIPNSLLTASSVHGTHKLWQSTPVNPEVKISRPTFVDSCDLEKSPSKRRKPSVKKSSRDLFQSSRKKTSPSFPQPLLWEHPSTSSSSQSCMHGRQTVDFLFYLGKHSILQPALDAILGYLEPVDLCRASVVSRSWKHVIEGVPSAMLRKKDYVDRCSEMKENLHQSTKKSEGTLPIRGQLISIQNFSRSEEVQSRESRSPPVSPSKAVFNLFVKEGRKLDNGQTLLPCPQCKLPSRKEPTRSARCTRSGCQYHFCILCFCKFHGDKPCPVSSVKHRRRLTAIGSRESRRNLQRLCK